VQKVMQALEREHCGMRTLLREVVLSVPFRNGQGDVAAVVTKAAPPVRRVKAELQ